MQTERLDGITYTLDDGKYYVTAHDDGIVSAIIRLTLNGDVHCPLCAVRGATDTSFIIGTVFKIKAVEHKAQKSGYRAFSRFVFALNDMYLLVKAHGKIRKLTKMTNVYSRNNHGFSPFPSVPLRYSMALCTESLALYQGSSSYL